MPPGEFIGRQLGDFRIVERIGEGAMATVYRAYQSSVNRDVALKIIRLDEALENKDEFQRRFAQEAEMIARLEHIHILPVYGYGIEADVAYLAMRWLRGGTLSDRLRSGPLPLDQTARLFEQIANGLGYAHSKGVIHRDLKPSNIMLDDAGNAYLTDFGLAKLIEGSADLTKSGNIVGTPAYMAPEQLRGEPLDARADLYSLGVILYHMVCGRLPFDVASSDIVTVIYQHLETPPRRRARLTRKFRTRSRWSSCTRSTKIVRNALAAPRKWRTRSTWRWAVLAAPAAIPRCAHRSCASFTASASDGVLRLWGRAFCCWSLRPCSR